MNILIISPHCDDAEFGCGGYISRMVNSGHHIAVRVVTVGITLFDSSILIRLSEFDKSMQSLGVKDTKILFYGFDSQLYTLSFTTIITTLEDEIRDKKYDEILFSKKSHHQDHKTVWDACMAAFRPGVISPSVKKILAYEYPASFWYDSVSQHRIRAVCYVDITKFINDKLKSVSQYKSQISKGGIFSLENIDVLAKKRGMEIGVKYAERFSVIRTII